MQTLSSVRISKKQNLVENSITKMSECKKMGLGQKLHQLSLALVFLGIMGAQLKTPLKPLNTIVL